MHTASLKSLGFSRSSALLVGLVLAPVVSSVLHAQTINVAFGNVAYTGSGPYAGASETDHWNSIGLGPNHNYYYNVLDTMNVETPIIIEVSAENSTYLHETTPGNGVGLFDSYFTDGSHGVSSVAFIVANLTPFQAYDLYVYVGRNSAEPETALVLFNNGGGSVGLSYVGTQNAFTEGSNYAHVVSVAPPGGSISFLTFSEVVTGLTIAPVAAIPEPATCGLLIGGGLFGCVLGLRRRRRVG